MSRPLRRLPTPIKLIAFALLVLLLSTASNDASSRTLALVLLGGTLAWWVVLRPTPTRRRAPRRRTTSRPRRSPGLAARLWRRTTARRARPVRSAAPRPVTAADLGEILALTPTQFEDFTLNLLRGLGYTALRRTGGPRDLSVDIAGRDPLGRTAVVQCKQYAPHRKIGSPTVQTFIGMMTVHHRADHGLMVSTAGFTTDAIRLAQHHGIDLIDGAALRRWLRDGDGALGRHIERSWGQVEAGSPRSSAQGLSRRAVHGR